MSARVCPPLSQKKKKIIQIFTHGCIIHYMILIFKTVFTPSIGLKFWLFAVQSWMMTGVHNSFCLLSFQALGLSKTLYARKWKNSGMLLNLKPQAEIHVPHPGKALAKPWTVSWNFSYNYERDFCGNVLSSYAVPSTGVGSVPLPTCTVWQKL